MVCSYREQALSVKTKSKEERVRADELSSHAAARKDVQCASLDEGCPDYLPFCVAQRRVFLNKILFDEIPKLKEKVFSRHARPIGSRSGAHRQEVTLLAHPVEVAPTKGKSAELLVNRAHQLF